MTAVQQALEQELQDDAALETRLIAGICADTFEDFIRAKVVPVNGDVGNENLGMDEAEAAKIMADCDVIINGRDVSLDNKHLELWLRFLGRK